MDCIITSARNAALYYAKETKNKTITFYNRFIQIWSEGLSVIFMDFKIITVTSYAYMEKVVKCPQAGFFS